MKNKTMDIFEAARHIRDQFKGTDLALCWADCVRYAAACKRDDRDIVEPLKASPQDEYFEQRKAERESEKWLARVRSAKPRSKVAHKASRAREHYGERWCFEKCARSEAA